MHPRADSRAGQLHRALQLSYLSIGWGVVSGIVAVLLGLAAGSLGLLGVGLGVFADVGGSVAIAWRTRVEQADPVEAVRAERVAAQVVMFALAGAASVLVVGTVVALATGSRVNSTVLAMVSAAVNVLVLTPLGIVKRRLGTALSSLALRGDGLLSLLGAAMAALALGGLVLDRLFGWWWADRVAALLVAALAAAEALQIRAGHGAVVVDEL